MTRRWTHLSCSLWLIAASLLPGTGWALCVGAGGHVAVEVVGPATLEHGLDESGSACRDNCMTDACESCHDVQLESLEPSSIRRDLSAASPAILIAVSGFTAPYPHVPAAAIVPVRSLRAAEAPHLACVLRR